MTRNLINTIAIWGPVLLLALLLPALCHSTSIHCEDVTPIGDDRMVVIDSANITYAELEAVCKALPLEGYGYAITKYGTVIILEAQRDACWEMIKEYIDEAFKDLE